MINMKFVSDALDGLGRWYVAVPPFLIIGFLAALFFLTGAGQERLQEASERPHQSPGRVHAIDELQTALARSVATQRAYLVTGEPRFQSIYARIVANVEP